MIVKRKVTFHSLLGARIKGIYFRVPQLEDFYKEAEKDWPGAGGRIQRLKEFKPHYQMIREGVKLQEEASRQLTRFHEKKEEELRQTGNFYQSKK